jgi:hypothetical protein
MSEQIEQLGGRWKIHLLDLLSSAIQSHPQVAPTLQLLVNRVNSMPATVDPATILSIITAVLGLLAALGTSGIIPVPANLKAMIDGFVTQINTLLAAVPPPLGPLPALPLP